MERPQSQGRGQQTRTYKKSPSGIAKSVLRAVAMLWPCCGAEWEWGLGRPAWQRGEAGVISEPRTTRADPLGAMGREAPRGSPTYPPAGTGDVRPVYEEKLDSGLGPGVVWRGRRRPDAPHSLAGKHRKLRGRGPARTD